MSPISQSQFIPLGEILCLAISAMNSARKTVTQETLIEHLATCFPGNVLQWYHRKSVKEKQIMSQYKKFIMITKCATICIFIFWIFLFAQSICTFYMLNLFYNGLVISVSSVLASNTNCNRLHSHLHMIIAIYWNVWVKSHIWSFINNDVVTAVIWKV